MKLSYTKLGKGSPLLILHGLYGSGSNWHTIARALSNKYTIYLIDQRNHGSSPHHADISYPIMAEDLNRFINDHNLDNPCIIGHSMGGKVAIQFAMLYPHKLKKLVVVDIAIRNYSPSGSFTQQALVHQNILKALSELDVLVENRNEIDHQLSKSIDQPDVRNFLLKNLRRSKDGSHFYWQINLLALQDNLDQLLGSVAIEGTIIPSPTLVISGKRSGYINDEDKAEYQNYFTHLTIKELDAGHWVHAEKTEEFINLLKEFLKC